MENKNLKYIIYLTINILNNKIYIGIHLTETPYIFDGYLGCGVKINTPSSYNKGKTPFHNAILKYGIKNFKRITLKVFNTLEEALLLEKDLVNLEFIKRTDTYNSCLGGGVLPKNNKEINQFDINGNFIKTWKSGSDINKFYDTSVNFSNIILEKRSFAGFLWSFEKEINVCDYKKENNHGFISYYNKDGILLGTFKNTTILALKLNLKRESITNAVFKKKIFCGYYFLKSDVDIAEVLSNKYKKTLGKKLIHRYLASGEYDKSYISTSKAVNDTPKSHTSSLKNAVINGYKCGGYLWSYIKASNYYDIENPKLKSDVLKIDQYDLNGIFIKTWNSYKECKKYYKYCLRVCNGTIKSTLGYIFKYKNS